MNPLLIFQVIACSIENRWINLKETICGNESDWLIVWKAKHIVIRLSLLLKFKYIYIYIGAMWKYLRLWAIALELNFCWIYAAVLSLAGNVYISLRFSCWQYLFFSEVLFPVIVFFLQGSLRSCCSGRVNKRMTAWSCLQLIALSSPHLLKWLDWIMRPAWWYWFYNLRLTTTTRARRESDFWHACYVIRVNFGLMS